MLNDYINHINVNIIIWSYCFVVNMEREEIGRKGE